jgi:hypothetical protein
MGGKSHPSPLYPEIESSASENEQTVPQDLIGPTASATSPASQALRHRANPDR